MEDQKKRIMTEEKSTQKFEGSRWHSFFVGEVFQNLRIAFKPAIAVAITLAIGQNTGVSVIESSTMYVSAIFATLLMPNKTRIVTIETTLVAGILIGLAAPYGMLAFLCAKATRDPATDARQFDVYEQALQSGNAIEASPALFYQGRPAAVAALFLFVLAWISNVCKALFPKYTFAIVVGTIACGIFLIEGYLFPTWELFYTIVKQVFYCAYIGVASAFAVNIFVFPYNAREPYLVLTGKFLDLVEQMVTKQATHFSNMHVRLRDRVHHGDDVTASTSSNSEQESEEKVDPAAKHERHKSKEAPDELAQLQALRHALTAVAASHHLAKAPAKKEVAYGHMRSSELESMHKLCRALLIPVFGCNLWSQIVEIMRTDVKDAADGKDERISFLESLGTRTELGAEEEAAFFTEMEEQVSPRVRSISADCSDAITHIKRVLHLGQYKRPPFYIRPFVASPPPLAQDELDFADIFEARIADFWAHKHAASEAFDSANHNTPHVSTLLIVYMESTLHVMALQLLDFVRWADKQHSTGIMTSRRLVLPKPKSFTKPIMQTMSQLGKHLHDGSDMLRRSQTNADLVGRDESLENNTYQPDAAEAFLVQPKPRLRPRTSFLSRFLLFFYRFKLFVFDSPLSGFGLRAAVAMMAGALPAYFPDSVGVFLKYRLIWITFTVLLGLQPVLGRGLAAAFFRCLGTIAGGVIGLIVVEIGRVPAGIIPVFFISIFPQFYILQLNPKAYLIPVLLSVVTEDLVVGYEVMTQKLGRAVVERSGQIYLAPPAVCGYRILLTLAGVVIVLIFCICPGLSTAKDLLRRTVANRLYTLADTYMLCSIRSASDRFDLPPGIDKAIQQKQVEGVTQSAMSQEFLGMTTFEPSIQGVFPKHDWVILLELIDNFATALAVSNALYTRIEQGDTSHALDLSRVGMHSSKEELFRVISATLLALNGAIEAWHPLAPILRSPVRAHGETQKRMMTVGSLLRDRRRTNGGGGGGVLSPDVLTHYGAHAIANAILSRYLEDMMRQTGLLIGESGFRSYLSTHRKSPPSPVKSD